MLLFSFRIPIVVLLRQNMTCAFNKYSFPVVVVDTSDIGLVIDTQCKEDGQDTNKCS